MAAEKGPQLARNCPPWAAIRSRRGDGGAGQGPATRPPEPRAPWQGAPGARVGSSSWGPWPVLFCQRLCRALSPQLRLKLGDMWGLSYPTKRLSYPVPLSCPLRVYISVAPQLTPTYPLEPIYPLGSTWASYQVPPPVILHISPLGHGAGWCRVPRWVF